MALKEQKRGIIFVAEHSNFALMYQSNGSFNILPGQPPGIWILGKILFKFQPHSADPPPGKLPEYYKKNTYL